MFLWQKLKYKLIFLDNPESFEALNKSFTEESPNIVAFDTETTGLHIIKDKPFLIGFGFHDKIYIYEQEKWRNDFLYSLVKRPHVGYFIAHHAKFDYHMMKNVGSPIPKGIKIADSLALARITDYVDSLASIGLEHLGATLVDPESKFAGKVIKKHLEEINKSRRLLIKKYVSENIKNISYTKFNELRRNKVQFVDTDLDKHFDKVDELAPAANYLDSYIEKPGLMINYLADDVVLVLEICKVLLPILDEVDKDRKTWHRENELIRVVGDMERIGMRADINYLLSSRLRVMDYKERLYEKLHSITDLKFTVGQSKVIKEMFANKYKIGMLATDENALEEVCSVYDGDAVTVAKLILELRTVEKWLSTYINGMLNRIYHGKVYTEINNSGASTGRVSSDLQQQPKEGLKDSAGNELFHPRKIFINDDGYRNFYIDFSNMELRVQAQYTLYTSDGDLNMCRAFMPFKCYDSVTGEMYDLVKDKKRWNEPVWVYEDGTPWTKLDLHTETTKKAFPNIDPDSQEFKEHYRSLGKRANFLKNYGGGKGALIVKLKITEDVADALNRGYYQAFPKVLDYQRWVDNKVRTYGNIENLMGRRYYFQDTNFSYRGYNYLIQGSCADYVKEKEIELFRFLEPYQSRMVMPIHDEIIFSIKRGEEHIVPKLKAIMEDADIIMPQVPMVAEVEYSETNWAEKESWNES